MSKVIVKFNDAGWKELEAEAQLFLQTTAENIRVEAQSLVNTDTFKLRDSIEVSQGKTKWYRLVGSDVEYAIYQEMVIIRRKNKAGEEKQYKIGKAYLRPALDKIIASLQ